MKLNFQDITELFPELPLLAQKILTLAEKTTPLESLRDPSLPVEHTFSNNNNVHEFSNFSHIALANAVHHTLILPKDIQMIANDFWKHAFYAAVVCEKCARLINDNNKRRDSQLFNEISSNEISLNNASRDEMALDAMDTELCYLLGFTHNFGFLLFGYLFKHEFRLLNKWMHQYPDEPVEKLEKKLLGMGNAMHIVHGGHAQLGAWLMEYWRLPEPFILAAGLHHERDYQGPYASYIRVIQFTNYLLKKIGIGEGATLSDKSLKSLNISIESAEVILKEVLIEGEELFSKQMALEIIN